MMCSTTLQLVLDTAIGQSHVTTIQNSAHLLNSYLEDLPERPLRIETILTDEETATHQLANEYGTTDGLGHSEPYSLNAVKLTNQLGADVLVTRNLEFERRFGLEEEHNITIADSESVARVMEYFAAGHEIPWAFRKPLWYMPWTNFYPFVDKDGERATSFWEQSCLRDRLSLRGQERLRSMLINRFEYIMYTRDKLLSYRLQRRAAKRCGAKNQDFNLECGHLLGYYYILLAGGLDQLALVTNELLDLGVTNPVQVSLLKSKFISRIRSVHPDLASLFAEKQFEDWKTKLKMCRDFVTHQSTAHLAQLVNPPKAELTDDEVDALARQRPEFQSFSLLPEEQRDKAFDILKQNVRISQIDVWRDDALVIDDPESLQVILPLRDIEWNYDNYSRVVFATLELLEKTNVN